MKSFVLLLLSTLAVFGQVPSFKSFNPAQFNTNNFMVSIKDGATLTNITIRNSLTLPSLPDSTITLNGVTITNWTDIGPVETNSLWIEIAGVLQPLIGNQVLVTNLSSQSVLSALGALTMPASYSTNLVAGTNCLNPYNLGSVWITGADATATGSSISLVSGNGQGQLLILQNYSTNSGFTMYNGIPFCDGSGGFIRLNGDWATTNRGDTLFLYNTGQIWTEVGRAYASTNSIADSVWVNESGHIHPVDGNANNVLTFTSGLADNATNVAFRVDTTNSWSLSGGRLADFHNNSIVQNRIRSDGAIGIGTDSLDDAFGFTGSDIALASVRKTDAGDAPSNAIFLLATKDDGWSQYSYVELEAQKQPAVASESAHLLLESKGTNFESSVRIDMTELPFISLSLNSTEMIGMRPGVLSSGSAIAYLFDTSNYLNTSGDLLAAFKNAGTNANVINSYGGMYIGKSAREAWTPGDDEDGLIIFHNSSLNEGSSSYLFIGAGVTNDPALPNASFLTVETDAGFPGFGGFASLGMVSTGDAASSQSDFSFILDDTSIRMNMRSSGTERTILNPTIASSGSAVSYLFDTSNTLTNGDKLVSIKNAGVEQLSVSMNGGLAVGPNTIPFLTTPTEDGAALKSIRYADSEPNHNELFIETTDNDGENTYSTFQSLVTTNTARIQLITYDGTNQYTSSLTHSPAGAPNDPLLFTLSVGGGTQTSLSPGVANGAGSIAYQFDTANTLSTSGALIASFKNNGTRYLDIDKTGVVLFGPGTTNALYRSSGGVDLNYTNGVTTPLYFNVTHDGGSAHFGVSGTTTIIRADTSALVSLAPDNASASFSASSSGFFPSATGKTLGAATANNQWNQLLLESGGKISMNGTTNSVFIIAGSGSPESSVTAAPGSIYMNFAGGSLTTLWVKESGTGNTGWIGK